MAARFDASGDYLVRTTNIPANTAFTLMAWVYIVTDRNAYSQIFEYGNPDALGDKVTILGLGSDGTQFNVYGGGSDTDHLGSQLTVATWYHACLSCSGTALTGYLNGVSNVTTTRNVNVVANSMRLANDFNSEWLNGRIAAVKIYAAALTAAEILQEMRQYAPVRTLNLNTFLPLLNVVSDFPNDYSGSANTMTAGGTLTAEDGPPIPWRQGRRRARIPAAAAGAAFVARRPLVVGQAVQRAAFW